MVKEGIFTAKGRLLVEVMDKPGITIKELATRLYLTKRTVWGCVGDLRRIGYLNVQPSGRVHHYFVSSKALAELRKVIVDKETGW